MYRKRLLVCLLGGCISALVCLVSWQVVFGFPEILWENIAATVANRILLGFIIGISGWRLNHLFHGALLGLPLSLSVAIWLLPDLILNFALFTAVGWVYGVFIEWLATDLFKAPIRGA
ncbi:MAG: hypothetical protein ACK2TW_02730 [Anaerolineales bacterium]|jgi:hypothetical protein